MNIGVCKLCLQEKELLKKSHIFPEFLCRPWKIDSKSFTKVKLDEFSRISEIQTNPFVKDSLCESCDTVIISGYETYIQQYMFLPLKRVFSDFPNEAIGPVPINANPGKVKLFLLSILWRCTLKSDFSYVKLGTHEEKIRKMLLNSDPGKSDDYPFSIFYLAGDPESQIVPFSNMLLPPFHQRKGSSHYYIFLIPEFFVRINISKQGFQKKTIDYPIDENNFIVHVIRGKDSDEFSLKILEVYRGALRKRRNKAP
ncbi:MAG: hypothetical protein AB7V07_01875 [Candidatus Delongbacteria bacterium]